MEMGITAGLKSSHCFYPDGETGRFALLYQRTIFSYFAINMINLVLITFHVILFLHIYIVQFREWKKLNVLKPALSILLNVV